MIRQAVKVYQSGTRAFSTRVILSDQVRQALDKKKAVVALESTIISHGMPYPQNIGCAKNIEEVVSKQGAVPATIAIIDKKIHVGLSERELQRLAEEGSQGKVRKISRRDMAHCLQAGGVGATTVSGTMMCAHMAGIDVFVTGGIGGVHRNVEETWDISADLTELGRTPVAVVSAGVKSILDIPKTLQYLETEGVPVITYGSDDFPAFYSSSSGIKSPMRLDSETHIASVIHENQLLRNSNGILIAVPNPNPAEGEEIETAIQKSITELRRQNITGHRVTPFLLKSVSQLTKGRSLNSNISLVMNNAKVGANIAVELAKIKHGPSKQIHINKQKTTINRPLIIGGSAIDTYISPLPGRQLQMARSNPGKIRTSYGGVGRNITEVVGRLGAQPHFVTALGMDDASNYIINYMSQVGVKTHPIKTAEEVTGRYMHVMKKNGDLSLGVADMDVNHHLTFDNIYEAIFREHDIAPGTIVQVDSNVKELELKKLIPFLNEKKARILVEGISSNCIRILESGCLNQISLLKINQIELGIYKKKLQEILNCSEPLTNDNFYMDYLVQIIGKKNTYTNTVKPFRYLLVTRGQKGSDLYEVQNGKLAVRRFPILTCKVLKTNGAGDTMTGGLITSLNNGNTIEDSIKFAICCTKFAVETPIGQSTISDMINMTNVKAVFETANL